MQNFVQYAMKLHFQLLMKMLKSPVVPKMWGIDGPVPSAIQLMKEKLPGKIM